MKQKILQQGAEAVIIKKENKVIKDRIKKSYRISELDERIRKLRTRGEARLLDRSRKLISIPKIVNVDESKKEIIMDFIDGKKLSEHLDNFSIPKQKQILLKIGQDITKLHDANIIHGDLTTSNMILVENQRNLPTHSRSQINKNSMNKKTHLSKRSEPIIYFIDFGLGFISHKYEDKAVDIHLLRQALESRHFKNWETFFKEFLKGYNTSKDSKITLERLKAVEKRGRYKH